MDRKCKYINCNQTIIGSSRKKYCCSTHRVRQWEINKGKPNFIPQVNKIRNIQSDVPSGLSIVDNDYHVITRRGEVKNDFKNMFTVAGVALGLKGCGVKCAFGFAIAGRLLGSMIDNSRATTVNYIPKQKKPLESKFDTIAQMEKGSVMSSVEYRKAIIPSIEVSSKYQYLFGNPSKNFYLAVTGSPGQGKSTFCVQLGEYFQQNHGKVIYLASEQFGANLSLQKLFDRYNTTFDIHTKPKTMDTKGLMNTISGYDLVVFDSVNHMNLEAEQIEDLRNKCKNVAFVVVLQSTKDGFHKGSQDWKHNCDIFIKCEQLKAKAVKTRFGKLGEIEILA